MELFRLRGFLTLDECDAIRRGMDDGTVEHAEILDQALTGGRTFGWRTLIDPGSDLIRDVEMKLDACRERVAARSESRWPSARVSRFIRYPRVGSIGCIAIAATIPSGLGRRGGRFALVVVPQYVARFGARRRVLGGVLRLFLPQHEVDIAPEQGCWSRFQQTFFTR
jgi:hypothetical protein